MITRNVNLDEFDVAPQWTAYMLRVLHDELARRHRMAERQSVLRDESVGLLAWSHKYLPEHFTRPASVMHRWLAGRLDKMWQQRATKLNLLGPRGGAKSTIGTLAYPLRAAVEHREPYIWIVSDTKHQACAHLENVKAELLDNSRLRADFPDAAGRGPVWRSGSIVLNNGVAIEAFGTGQRIRGRRRQANRPTLIVCDDLENDDHMQSAQARRRSRTWFHGTLMKAGTSRTNILNLATALHREALAMQLDQTPGWTSKIFKAIRRWPKNTSLWEEWETLYTAVDNPNYQEAALAFYEEHQVAMDDGASVLWPEEEDLYMLMRMRAESGRTAFEREKQNSPVDPELCEWPESYFDESIWFDDWPRGLEVKTIALDPSKGTDSHRGDYSAFVKLGMDARGIFYLEADLARRPTPQIVADGVELYRRFQPDAFGIESNQFQELLAGEFDAEFHRQGILGVRPWLLDNRVNKLVRIRRLGPYLSAGRLRLKNDSPSTRLLVNQLKDFPIGDHDDGPDAAEMAIRLAGELLGRTAVADGLGSRLPVG